MHKCVLHVSFYNGEFMGIAKKAPITGVFCCLIHNLCFYWRVYLLKKCVTNEFFFPWNTLREPNLGDSKSAYRNGKNWTVTTMVLAQWDFSPAAYLNETFGGFWQILGYFSNCCMVHYDGSSDYLQDSNVLLWWILLKIPFTIHGHKQYCFQGMLHFA